MKYLVIGGARSGVGASIYLKKRDLDVVLIESKTIKPQYKELLSSNLIPFYENTSSYPLEEISWIVPSPGVPLDIPLILQARQHQIPIVSEVDLALHNYPGKLITVTGTNGKSTVSAMIHHILHSLDPSTLLGGNFEIPPTELFWEESIKQNTKYLVLEISSYQSESSSFNADAAVFTSFSEDHLKRHKTMFNYFMAKWKMIENLKPKSLLLLSQHVLDFANENIINIPSHIEYKIIEDLSSSILVPKELNLSSIDTSNALSSTAICSFITGKDPCELIQHLLSFKTLEHRLEYTRTYKNIKIINDSKSTNCDTVLTAIRNYPRSILMLGGECKKEDFSPLLQYQDSIDLIIFFGQDRGYLKDNIVNAGYTGDYVEFNTLKEALTKDKLKPILDSSNSLFLLFSPGCASFDEFENFEHRGKFFKEEISKL